jgi:hypothetical protein
VRLTVDGQTLTAPLTIRKDPRAPTTPDDFARQTALALQIRDKLSAANEGVIKIRDARKQLEAYGASANKAVAEAAKALTKELTAVEQELYQTKNQSGQDPLNFPIKLNNKLAALGGVVAATDIAPTAQSMMVFEDLASQTNVQFAKLDKLLKADLAAFNKLVHDQNVPAVVLKGIE